MSNTCLLLAQRYTRGLSLCCFTYTYQIDKGTEMPRYGNLLQATQARKKNGLVPKHILTWSTE